MGLEEVAIANAVIPFQSLGDDGKERYGVVLGGHAKEKVGLFMPTLCITPGDTWERCSGQDTLKERKEKMEAGVCVGWEKSIKAEVLRLSPQVLVG